MDKKSVVRRDTLVDLEKKLKEFGRCALVRNTGFGKTWLLSELISKYSKVLFLYPSDVIKDTVIERCSELSEDYLNNEYKEEFKAEVLSESGKYAEIDNVTFMSYNKVARLNKSDTKSIMGYDLIIADECHRIGAKGTKVGLDLILESNTNVHFVGATATPDRSDAFDVIEYFFNDVVVFEYTLHNSFEDGILKKPYYCYCTYDIEGTVRKDLKKASLDLSDANVKEVINSKLIEISNIYNMENIIRDVCSRFARSTSYMKFIVFFSNFKHIDDKGSSVIEWFSKAFPNHSIETLTVTSKTKEFLDNVHKLGSLKKRDNTIDLIFCVDMLNMGYHVSDLTGILMYRGTESGIIYTQQLGRALNSGSEDACIVFDVVDNLHRKAVYELYEKDESTRRIKASPILKSQKDILDVEGLSNEEIFELSSTLQSSLEPTDRKWWKFCNHIRQEDLIATGHDATYRELLAKLIAEPKVQRCRVAFERFFKRWCMENGIPYPIGKSELEELLKVDKELFIDYILSVRDKYKMNFKLDKEWLLDERVSSLSLSDYAKAFDVTLNGVLEQLGVV